MESLKMFVLAIYNMFKAKYLWQLIMKIDLKHLQINVAMDFPRMFTSLNCMCYHLNIHHVAWHGLFINKHKLNIYLWKLYQSLWIWHYDFELMYIGNNGFNVFDCSPMANDMLEGVGNEFSFKANVHLYLWYHMFIARIYKSMGYFHVDYS